MSWSGTTILIRTCYFYFFYNFIFWFFLLFFTFSIQFKLLTVLSLICIFLQFRILILNCSGMSGLSLAVPRWGKFNLWSHKNVAENHVDLIVEIKWYWCWSYSYYCADETIEMTTVRQSKQRRCLMRCFRINQVRWGGRTPSSI